MLSYKAMEFARQVHAEQRRKYTNGPYFDHLAEVVGIVSSVVSQLNLDQETVLAVAWLHDCVEDQGVLLEDLSLKFGDTVAIGVGWLSDMELGNRDTRKRLSRERLSKAPEWIQTIKCADLISNTSSIVQHDPKFAITYLEEKRLLLDVLTKAEPNLLRVAKELSMVKISFEV